MSQATHLAHSSATENHATTRTLWMSLTVTSQGTNMLKTDKKLVGITIRQSHPTPFQRKDPYPRETPPSRVTPILMSPKVLNNTTMTFIDCRNGNERSKFLHQCDNILKLFIQAIAGHVFPKPDGLCVLEL